MRVDLKGSRLANLSQYQNDQRLKIRVNFHYAWLAYCFVIFFSSFFYPLQLHYNAAQVVNDHYYHQVLIAHAKPKQTVLTLNPIRNTNNAKPEKMGGCNSLEHNGKNWQTNRLVCQDTFFFEEQSLPFLLQCSELSKIKSPFFLPRITDQVDKWRRRINGK